MSEPIKSKNGDISKAPTPQNTPASVSNSYLKSQPPSVSTIAEEGETKGIGKQLANNPALLSMIEGKLGTLVGQQSGYIDSLPKSVKKRVFGLKSIQQQQMKLEADFQRELLSLEKKYFKKYEPLYERRKKIINGAAEPTPEEVEEGEALKEEEEGEDKIKEEEEDDNEDDSRSDEKGIPGFWLTALENLSTVAETITDRDSEVLQYLVDVRMEYLETPGFELIFEFRENPFFSNTILSKTYHYQAELGYSGDFVYDHADGCEINWKSKENNVTINIERRKQRNKTTKQTRTIEKLTPTESFFNFFDPPKPPKPDEDLDDEDDEERENDDLEARLELDYQLGEEIKDRLIPRAIDWFTGDAVGFDFPEDFEDEEDEEIDSEEEDSEDEAPKQNPPECNQQ
ncbi:Piso0_003448 [Millerozyma farinosa CBS 7064]|uniref:Piso0_003448 protein n=1 Tax=Pichia sorbitophila (strain ATCC MYA-4447 / BCRC 22081 / CBS 7064 / NBRC 10061 / NRRL Y-12695) TaxID=559304 RepID=G8YJ38_PICSO|nr:Piso0_003448 [Millerozyma farinosa CBS 7064]CCE81098.1 Piso0_003448 [Millerozyma farinosa CBS 7064]